MGSENYKIVGKVLSHTAYESFDETKVPDWFYKQEPPPRHFIWITEEVIKKTKPCTDRRANYLEHYSGWEGSFSDFCDLDKITNADKKWISNRLFDVQQKFAWTMLILHASIDKAVTRGFNYTLPMARFINMMSQIYNPEYCYDKGARDRYRKHLTTTWQSLCKVGLAGHHVKEVDVHRVHRAIRLAYEQIVMEPHKLELLWDYNCLGEEVVTPYLHYPDGTLDMDAFEEYCELSITFLKMASET